MNAKPFASERREPTWIVRHDLVRLQTRQGSQFVDLTGIVAERVRRSGVSDGLVNIQTRHTTTAILVNENEPRLIEDLETLLEKWAPRDATYRHDDLEARRPHVPPGERKNGHAHARAIALGTSESLNVVDGEIQLGKWQRIFFVELDGARRRQVSLCILGTRNPNWGHSALSFNSYPRAGSRIPEPGAR